MYGILQAAHMDGEVVVPVELNTAETPYFNLIVSSYDDSVSVVIGLRFPVLVTDVRLEGGNIVI